MKCEKCNDKGKITFFSENIVEIVCSCAKGKELKNIQNLLKEQNQESSYKTIWNKFWKAINENPNEIFIKEILLDLKDDFEKMVQND